jgi:hypothetical protein
MDAKNSHVKTTAFRDIATFADTFLIADRRLPLKGDGDVRLPAEVLDDTSCTSS